MSSFTPGPWYLIGPQPTGATGPGAPKWDRDPEEYEIREQPPFTRGFTHTVAIVIGKENARLIAAAPMLRDALKRLTVAARTSGGVSGRDDEFCAVCDYAEAALAKITDET